MECFINDNALIIPMSTVSAFCKRYVTMIGLPIHYFKKQEIFPLLEHHKWICNVAGIDVLDIHPPEHWIGNAFWGSQVKGSVPPINPNGPEVIIIILTYSQPVVYPLNDLIRKYLIFMDTKAINNACGKNGRTGKIYLRNIEIFLFNSFVIASISLLLLAISMPCFLLNEIRYINVIFSILLFDFLA